jgi:hypothetical protein
VGTGQRAIRANPARLDRRAIRGPPDQPDPSGRLVRLDQKVACHGDEVMISAYCGPARNRPTFLDERQASCGINPTAADKPLIAFCAQAPQ